MLTNSWRRNSRRLSRWFPLVFTALTAVGGGFAGATDAPSAVRWFAATADFVDEREITAGEARLGWAVAQEPRRNGVEVRRLYHNGELQEVEETRYRTAGGGTGAISVPVHVERRDALGEALWTMTLQHRPDGTVRLVRRCSRDNQCITVRYAPAGEPGEERLAGPDFHLTIRYNEGSLPEYILREGPGESREEEWLSYRDGRLVERRVLRDQRETVVRYDGGHVVSEEQRENGILVSREIRVVDGDGVVLERTRETRSRREVDRFYTRRDDGLVQERLVNGVLVEQTFADPPGTRVERLRNGEVLFRSWVVDGAVVRRETLMNGEVIAVEIPGE